MKPIKEVIHKEHLNKGQKMSTNKMFNLIEHKKIYAKIAGKDYVYTKELKELLPELLKYFNGQRDCKYDINKGLYIYGEPGIGKSTVLLILRKYLSELYAFHPNAFLVSSVERILNHFKLEKNLDLFGFNIKTDDRGKYRNPINLLINEFGIEKDYDVKNYGTVFRDEYESMLMARYEVFTDNNKLTHCTSNLNQKELSKIYPDKLLDRFIEMFNFIELKGESWRK